MFHGMRVKGIRTQMIKTSSLFKAKVKYKWRNGFPVLCAVTEAQGDQENEEAEIKPGVTEHVPTSAIVLCVLEQSHVWEADGNQAKPALGVPRPSNNALLNDFYP